MPIFTTNLPLSLYIHLPWCVKKCPYCDFNSHAVKTNVPEETYVEALLANLDTYLPLIHDRPIISIFFGGGTPSLFSSESIKKIVLGVRDRLIITSDVEITLEANPGTIDAKRFECFRNAGVNRLSIGIQSLQDEKLKILGRIHSRDEALYAIDIAKAAGFSNFNLDIMYGLPNQTIDDAMHDIELALSTSPTHFSWYQLTIEPNTLFHHQPPELPDDETIWEMQCQGQKLIREKNFKQYEVSAFARDKKYCKHNLNYWEFGDYLGIGAGAHSKITHIAKQQVLRFAEVRHPKDYLDETKRTAIARNIITDKELIFEFMLNALRLTSGISIDLFTERTGICFSKIESTLLLAKQKKLLHDDAKLIRPTLKGKRFLNDLIALFL